MTVLLQLLINSLIAGAIYALVASGFSLIYSTNKFIHFAHGATVAISAYFLYYLFDIIGLNFALAVALTIIFASCLGFCMNFFIYKLLRKNGASSVILLIASVGLLILLESLIQIIFGSDIKAIHLIETAKGMEFMGALITPLQTVIVTTALILFFILFFFIKKTKQGKAIRAVMGNKDVAEIVGISSEKIYSWSFIIGSGIAGIAGILIGLEQNLTPYMGTSLMIKGLTAAIIGGIGSVHGAVLGAFLLGTVENFGIWYLPSGYKEAIAFILLFIFLLIRPQGILGNKKRNIK